MASSRLGDLDEEQDEDELASESDSEASIDNLAPDELEELEKKFTKALKDKRSIKPNRMKDYQFGSNSLVNVDELLGLYKKL